MRARHILGLASHVGLVLAVPTSPKSVQVALASGETIVCESTLDSGPCETFNAQDRCVKLGQVSHKVRNT